jgi:hypothetical protein
MTIFSFWAPATTCTQHGIGIYCVDSSSVRKEECRMKDNKNFYYVFLDSWRWSISFRTPFVKDLLKLLSPYHNWGIHLYHLSSYWWLFVPSFIAIVNTGTQLLDHIHCRRQFQTRFTQRFVRIMLSPTFRIPSTLVTYSFHPNIAGNESHTQYQDH